MFSAKFLFIIKESPVNVKEKSIDLVRVIHTSLMKLCKIVRNTYLIQRDTSVSPVSLNLEISAGWSLWQLL